MEKDICDNIETKLNELINKKVKLLKKYEDVFNIDQVKITKYQIDETNNDIKILSDIIVKCCTKDSSKDLNK